MMRLIGLTPTLDDHTRQITVNQDYPDSIARAGALPVLLPLTDDPAALEETLRRIDGLLLIGGGDVEPSAYGEKTLPACGEAIPLRDRMELYLCRRAVGLGLPVLGVCRGLQVLNVALGGTLYQDLATQFGEQIIHPRHDIPKGFAHEVTTTPGSRLRAVTGLKAFSVNSRHHQGIKALGRGLMVSAAAPDGLIEGIELPGDVFTVAVQWHPESLSAFRPEAQALFNAFAEACGL